MIPSREHSAMISYNVAAVSMPAKATGHLRLVLHHLVAVWLALVGIALLGLGQTSPSKMAAVVIVARAYGFEPASLGLSAGTALVIVDNRSGSPHLTMHLKDSSGLIVHDLPVSSGRQHWHEFVILTPGKYTLVEDGHSNWVCTITIE